MAFTNEVLDAILKDYHGPDDFYGPEGIMKQLTKALVERTMGTRQNRPTLRGWGVSSKLPVKFKITGGNDDEVEQGRKSRVA
jgi:hypothetical protein